MRELGQPLGRPVLVLHGGPGSGCSPLLWRFLDPTRFWIIAADQRGSGQSLPRGACEHNGLVDLLGDLRTIHADLGVQQPWLVVGGSWGATLALAHAADQPALVAGLLLRASFLGRPSDIDAFFTLGEGDPADCHAVLQTFQGSTHARLIDGLHAALHGNDAAQAQDAALAWWRWEQATSQPGQIEQGGQRQRSAPLGVLEPSALPGLLARLRVQSHYLSQGCGLQERPLLHRLDRVPPVPATLLHGDADRICPIEGASAIVQILRNRGIPVTFRRLKGVGHDPSHPHMIDAMVRALDAWADTGRLLTPGD